jgi:hypothetical protein
MHEAENRDEFQKLADELESADKAKYQEVIGNLRSLEYDDFANTRFATPKMQMIHDFEALGRQDIADRVRNGDFDQ